MHLRNQHYAVALLHMYVIRPYVGLLAIDLEENDQRFIICRPAFIIMISIA